MNILDLFPDEEDGFLLPLSAEMAIMNRIAELGFDPGDTRADRRQGLHIVKIHGWGIREDEYNHFMTEKSIKHLDESTLPNIRNLILQEFEGAETRIALIDANDPAFMNAWRQALRNDVDFVIAGVCNEKTDAEVLNRIQLARETGHFTYLVHSATSSLKGKSFSNYN